MKIEELQTRVKTDSWNLFGESWTLVEDGGINKNVKDCMKFNQNFHLNYVAEPDPSVPNHGKYYIISMWGGDNGLGDWVKYFDDLKQLFSKLKNVFGGNVWLIDLSCDCLDDVFDVYIGFRIK